MSPTKIEMLAALDRRVMWEANICQRGRSFEQIEADIKQHWTKLAQIAGRRIVDEVLNFARTTRETLFTPEFCIGIDDNHNDCLSDSGKIFLLFNP